MKRRDAVKITAGTFAFWTLSGVTISSMMSGCKTDGSKAMDVWKPEAFDQAQLDIVAEFCEMIIPRTDTPGAKDAGVHKYVDEAVARYFSEEEKAGVFSGLAKLEEVAKSLGASGFASADQKLKTAIMDRLVDDADNHSGSDEQHFFYPFRDFVKQAFFTSEVGATEVLAYDPVPGKYIGCLDISETPGKIWS